jgi:hypothetical protein
MYVRPVARILVLLIAVLALAACGGDSEPMSAPATEPETTTAETTTAEVTTEEATTAETTTEAAPPQPKAPPGVPRYVAGYRSWFKLNDAPIPPRDSDPHFGTKDVFASERRRDGRFPVGTVVVKEATRPGAGFIGLIAIMRKQRGADPEHNDWVFVEYTRDARNAAFGEQAAGAVCWSCHVGALDRDYVFTR